MAEDQYSTIREILGEFIGNKVVEITQHDEDYFKATGRSFVDLMFEDGNVLRFYCVTDTPFMLNPDADAEREAFDDEASA